jgi:hypothetical protein
VTVAWSALLLGRTSNWFPALRPFVIVAGSLGVVAILCLPYLRQAPKVAIGLVAALGFGAALAAPLFSSVATAAAPHDGAIPSVTPTSTGGLGGPGGPGGGFPGGGGFAPRGGPIPNGGLPGGGNFPGGGTFPGGGNFPGGGTGTGAGTGGTNPFQGGAPAFGGSPGGFGGPGGGGGGGFLRGSQSNAALDKLLQSNASRYTWAAATVSAENAAGYQLGSGEPVMAIGGFNGTDPAPTLSQFEKYVAEGKIHYFIAGGGGFGGGGFGGGQGGGTSSAASQIPSWVEAHFTAKTVGGVTVYDLTTGAS